MALLSTPDREETRIGYRGSMLCYLIDKIQRNLVEFGRHKSWRNDIQMVLVRTSVLDVGHTPLFPDLIGSMEAGGVGMSRIRW